MVHLAPESLCVASVVGELDRIDGVHLKAQQLQGKGGGLVSHIPCAWNEAFYVSKEAQQLQGEVGGLVSHLAYEWHEEFFLF
jgi:hypothetical protein